MSVMEVREMYKQIKVTVSFHCEKCNVDFSKPFHDVVTQEAGSSEWGYSTGYVYTDVTCPTCYTSYGIEAE